jgi:GT2 family glycosyltransferase
MKVGIVIVAHNASLAVRTTLASVRRARTRVPYELMLVDNASAPAERECIAHAFAVHRAILGDGWCYLPQDGNLGFSGGNNVAVRHFLERTDISHLCLLNSDVIVPHHWLDRLVEKGLPILSGVTNKAESDQCVPIDYEIQLHDCLLPDSETLAPEIAERVDAFAAARYRAFRGCTVEADVTFFCVLIERQAMATIGLLDEAFFPGGYEDNDYCLRAEAAGVPVHLARDTFIHHWGSASFAQLQHEYFSQRALHNIRYLEAKHGKPLEIHPEKPLISFGDDFAWALRTPTDPQYLSHLNALYRGSLTPLIGHFRSEFEALTAAAVAAAIELPTDLAERVQRLPHADDPVAGFAALSRDVDVMISQPPGHHELLRFRRRVVDTAATVREMVRANLEIHRALQVEAPPAAASATTASAASPTLLQKLHWALRKGGRFLWTFRGIVFFGGYPYPERESDGYFQRIQIVDGLFGDLWRVYVESTELPGRGRWIDRPAERVLVLRVMGGRWRRLMVRALATIAALRCGRVYYHSVLRTYDQRFGRLLRLPWLRKAIDIHGVVPEEFRFHNDFYSASLYDREERLAVRHSDLAIVVSEAMSAYLRQKYRAELKARVTTFPMFPPVTPDAGPRPYPGGRPTVVYAGGLHRWQQVPKMIAAIERTYEHCDHRFYTAKPEEVRAMLAPELRDRVVVESREHAELMGLYRHCHFGFLLREDVVVNHVACPTKAVEYFAKGVVPIVDSENIGDFVALGMRSVPLADFLAGRLPAAAERDEMAQQNLAVYERLKAQRDAGAHTIVARLGYPERRRISAAPLAARLKLRAARLLPRGTRRGHLARRLAARLSSAPGEGGDPRNAPSTSATSRTAAIS